MNLRFTNKDAMLRGRTLQAVMDLGHVVDGYPFPQVLLHDGRACGLPFAVVGWRDVLITKVAIAVIVISSSILMNEGSGILRVPRFEGRQRPNRDAKPNRD